jgi:quinol monooxygenase YgiN
MSEPETRSETARWRIDRFDVPAGARVAVIQRLGLIHAELGRLAGCLVNRIVERTLAPDRTEFLTLVAWRDEAALLAARRHMQRIHAETGFDPARFLAGHGVAMTPGDYRDVITARNPDPAP